MQRKSQRLARRQQQQQPRSVQRQASLLSIQKANKTIRKRETKRIKQVYFVVAGLNKPIQAILCNENIRDLQQIEQVL